MADTTFVDGSTTVVASWLNDVNDATYTTVPAHSATLASGVVLKDSSTGGAQIPSGTTAQRPGAPVGTLLRYNTTISNWEGYNGSVWGLLASGFASSGPNNDISKLAGITDYTGSLQLSNFRGGFQFSTAGASTTISIGPGAAMDSTNTMLMVLTAAMDKNTAAWVAGTGNGGRLGAAATANSTWYEFLEIYNPTTGAVDVGFDLPGVVTYPAGFTKSRHLAFWKTNASGQWEKFIHEGNRFIKDVPTLDVSTNPANTNAFTVTLDLPTSKAVIAEFDFHAYDPTNANHIIPRFSDLASTDTAPSFSATPLSPSISAGANSIGGAGSYKCRTNTSAQIRARLLGVPGYSTTAVLKLAVTAWVDNN